MHLTVLLPRSVFKFILRVLSCRAIEIALPLSPFDCAASHIFKSVFNLNSDVEPKTNWGDI